MYYVLLCMNTNQLEFLKEVIGPTIKTKRAITPCISNSVKMSNKDKDSSKYILILMLLCPSLAQFF